MTSSLHFKGDKLSELDSQSRRRFWESSLLRGDPVIFDGGGGVQNLIQKGLLNVFVANYFSHALK